MSFECNECHTKEFGVPIDETLHPQSYGRCEACGETKICADCSCWHKARAAAEETPGFVVCISSSTYDITIPIRDQSIAQQIQSLLRADRDDWTVSLIRKEEVR